MLTTEEQNEIRRCIRIYLLANDIDIASFGKMMDMKVQSIRNLLSGSTPISDKKVRQISDVLGYPYTKLVCGEIWLGKSELQKLEERVAGLERRLTLLEAKK